MRNSQRFWRIYRITVEKLYLNEISTFFCILRKIFLQLMAKQRLRRVDGDILYPPYWTIIHLTGEVRAVDGRDVFNASNDAGSMPCSIYKRRVHSLSHLSHYWLQYPKTIWDAKVIKFRIWSRLPMLSDYWQECRVRQTRMRWADRRSTPQPYRVSNAEIF